MLSFFYRKQKLFMTIVFICFGCVLFGYGLHSVVATFQDPLPLDKEVSFITVQGNKIPKYHLNILTNFLSKESQDFPDQLENWNFLNEGIITKFFLTNKCGEEVFKLLQTQLQEEWQFRFLEEQKFLGYINPEMPIISVQNVWKKFSEKLYDSFHDFISLPNLESAGVEAFKKKVTLFLEQRNFPGYLVRQVINYQESNYKCKSLNYQGSFNVFSYDNLQDWFGRKFLINISRIIIEIAEKAKQSGFTVSRTEVLSFVQNSTQQAFNLLKDKGFLDQVTFEQFYNHYVQNFFLSEKILCKVIQDILLFKKFLEASGNNFVYDYELFKGFLQDINQSFEVSFESFPNKFVFNSKEYLNYFETYLELVGETRNDVLELPNNYLSTSDLKKNSLELIGTQYQLRVAHVNTRELEHLIPLKEVFDWLMIRDNVDTLNQIYSEINLSFENVIDEYLSLENKIQKMITSFIKNDLFLKKISLIEEKLKEKMTSVSENKYFVSDCIYPALPGLVNISDFETALSDSKNSCLISQDNQNYYLIEKLQEKKDHIISYEDSLYLGILKKIVMKKGESKNTSLVINRLKEEYGDLDELTLLSHRFIKPLISYKNGSFKGELIKQCLPNVQRKIVKKTDVSEEEFIFLSSKIENENSFPIFSSKELGAYSYISVEPVYQDISFDKIFCLQNQVQFELINGHLLSVIRSLVYDNIKLD